MDFTSKIDFSPGSPARQQIQKDFNRPHWEPFKKWFMENFTKEDRKMFSDEFYRELSQKNVKISFAPWFITNYVDNYISVLEREYKYSHTNKILKSIFPPSQPFQIEKDTEIRFYNAFQKLLDSEALPLTTNHINGMMKQQNFANLYFIVLGEQILSLHERVEKVVSNLRELKKLSKS